MIYVGIFFALISIFCAIIVYVDKECARLDIFCTGAIAGICMVIAIVAIDDYCVSKITPMDVYKGKTTLQITYKDNVAIDSVVVWKEGIR